VTPATTESPALLDAFIVGKPYRVEKYWLVQARCVGGEDEQ
jgi:hypothetical protein